MKIKWYLKEEEYEKYRKHQHEYEDGDDYDYGDYIGSARIGNLCFDIINYGLTLCWRCRHRIWIQSARWV